MKKIIAFTILIQAMTSISAQEIIPLYEGKIPNSIASKNVEKSIQKEGILIISNISIPTLTLYLPKKEKSNGTAIIICPGGGYWVNAASHEGTDVAKKFTEMGFTAFVLKYRIPNDAIMDSKEIGPLQDAQQAIKIVRERATEWNVDPNKVGIMGFSAGGHLASTSGTHFESVFIPNEKNTSVRPDFMMLIYPVISFNDTIGSFGSRDQLIGKNPTPDKIRLYSNELHVTNKTPPTFLVHASDDEAVKSENSIVFYQALLQNKVPAEIHIFQKGGHGFGMINKTSSQLWMDWGNSWLESLGYK